MTRSTGVGLGLRPHHYPEWRRRDERSLPWLEVLADNYLFHRGGPALFHLDWFAERTDLVLHSVGLNLGSPLPFHEGYLSALRDLIKRIEPKVVSDHLCFSAASNGHSHDLLPLLRTTDALSQISDKIDRLQNFLGRRVAIENVSSYFEFPSNEFTETEFLEELCRRTGCGVLLDVNNVFVSAHNHGFNAWSEISKLSSEHVMQMHVAGHKEEDGLLIDTHDQVVKAEVWELLAKSLQRFSPEVVILERDDELGLDVLMMEFETIRQIVEAHQESLRKVNISPQ